jgi:hypothetical protein
VKVELRAMTGKDLKDDSAVIRSSLSPSAKYSSSGFDERFGHHQ